VELLDRTQQPKISKIKPNTTTLYRPSEEIFHFTFNFTISALNLYVTIHFHSFDILHWKHITFFLFRCRLIPRRRIDSMLRTTLFDTSWIRHRYILFTRNTPAFEIEVNKFHSAQVNLVVFGSNSIFVTLSDSRSFYIK
jgi:hypothetical protein